LFRIVRMCFQRAVADMFLIGSRGLDRAAAVVLLARCPCAGRASLLRLAGQQKDCLSRRVSRRLRGKRSRRPGPEVREEGRESRRRVHLACMMESSPEVRKAVAVSFTCAGFLWKQLYLFRTRNLARSVGRWGVRKRCHDDLSA
jgi:hypothetical protein